MTQTTFDKARDDHAAPRDVHAVLAVAPAHLATLLALLARDHVAIQWHVSGLVAARLAPGYAVWALLDEVRALTGSIVSLIDLRST